MFLIACSGGGGGNGADKTSTPGTAGPAASSTPSGTPTPHAQPTIEGNTFTFPGRGYAATIPNGWHANPNSLLAGPQSVDTFFAADTVQGVQSNISVTCEENPAHVSTDQFVQQRTATLKSLGANDLQTLAPATISGGVAAQQVTYTLSRNASGADIVVRKIDVMFTTQKCAWTVASASAPSAASQNATLFSQFIQSFKLLGAGATPSGGT